MDARIDRRLLQAKRSWNIQALPRTIADKRSLKLPNRFIWAGNAASLRTVIEGPDCAYIQRYPWCNRANCQLLLPFRERCPFFFFKVLPGEHPCRRSGGSHGHPRPGLLHCRHPCVPKPGSQQIDRIGHPPVLSKLVIVQVFFLPDSEVNGAIRRTIASNDREKGT